MIIKPEVYDDLATAFAWYGDIQSDLGQRLLDDFEKLISRIELRRCLTVLFIAAIVGQGWTSFHIMSISWLKRTKLRLYQSITQAGIPKNGKDVSKHEVSVLYGLKN
jgi:hypothetical protein